MRNDIKNNDFGVDLKVQRDALEGDPTAVCLVLAQAQPRLSKAIAEKVVNFTAELETVPDVALRTHVNGPSWYSKTNYDIAAAMRESGFYRHGDVWRYGVQSTKASKRVAARVPSKTSLKRLRLSQLCRLHTMVEDELKRRGR